MSSELTKFAITGVAATLIHILVVSILVPVYEVNAGLANGIAFILATVFSNVVNTLWSFKSEFSRRTTYRFWLVALPGCGLSVLISSLADYWGAHYLVGVALVVSIVPIVSFLLHKTWTYNVD